MKRPARKSTRTSRLPSPQRAILSKMRELSPEKLAQVEDFIDFLRQREGDRGLTQAANKMRPSKSSGAILRMPHTTGYIFGDVILIPFPFIDQSASKNIPAGVVSSDPYNARRPDIGTLDVGVDAGRKRGELSGCALGDELGFAALEGVGGLIFGGQLGLDLVLVVVEVQQRCVELGQSETRVVHENF
jgi:hypothetical protein